jgi:Fic family protein
MPNEGILISTLGLQEAKDSSAIENIVTTHDELFRGAAFPEAGSAATKEVARYSQALRVGFEAVKNTSLLSNNHIIEIQSYTKIEFIQRDLSVSRLTAMKYLDALATDGFLHKRKIGRSNYYINVPLYSILTGEPLQMREAEQR